MAVIPGVTNVVKSSDGNKRVETGSFTMPAAADGWLDTHLRHIEVAELTCLEGTDQDGLYLINSKSTADNEIGNGGFISIDVSTFGNNDYSYYVRGS